MPEACNLESAAVQTQRNVRFPCICDMDSESACSGGSQSVVCGPLRVLDTISSCLQGQNYFHKNIMMLFAFFPLDWNLYWWRNQWQIKLLGRTRRSRQWHQVGLVSTPCFLPALCSQWKKINASFFKIFFLFFSYSRQIILVSATTLD